ncbi:M16 family metallopeptidase [Verrucomicrobiota bacterium]
MDMNVRTSQLPNGIRVISSSLPHVESVTLGIWVGVGARCEAARFAGMSHFIEHLLFKGTSRRTAKDISQAVEGRGGYLNAFTQEENTCYYARVAHDHAWNALDVLADMYRHSRFDPREIEKERGVIIEEIMMYHDQPQHAVHDMLMRALWKGHPLGRPIAGEPEALRAMTRRHMVEFLRKKYVPSQTLIAIAGKVDHDRCVSKVKELMGSCKRGRTSGFRRVAASAAQDALVTEKRDIEQTHLALGIRLFGRCDKRRYTLKVLSAILGENMSSRLFQLVREKYGLAYSVSSSCHLYSETGALVVSAGLDRKRYLKALDLVVRELARLKERPVGRKELKLARDYVVGQLRLGLESTSNQMMWLGDNIMSHDRFIAPDESISEISKVTAEDIQRLARQVIKRGRTSLAVISPDLSAADKAQMRAALKKL